MRLTFVCSMLLFTTTVFAQQLDTLTTKTGDENGPDKMSSSYFEAATAIGNSYFSAKNKNINAKEQPGSLVVTPSVSYYHKSGIGLTTSAYLINTGDSAGFYQYSISPSYQLLNSKMIDATVSYTRYIIKKGYETIASPFKNEWYGQANLKKCWLQPGLSTGYANGSYTVYNKIDTMLLGARRRFTDTVTTRLSNFSLGAFVQHTFDFFELLSKSDELSITPQLWLNAGSSTYNELHQNPFYTRRLMKATAAKLIKRLGKLNQQTPFEIQSIALSGDVSYTVGNFTIDPQCYVDYYLPKTKGSRFSNIYSVQLSYDF